MALYGVDVHDGYQAGLSFPTLKRQGYSFAAVKLTQGTDYARGQGDDWVRAARAAGLIPGAYHWLNAADGAAQARWFWDKLKECGGPDGVLIQLDCEDNAGPTQIKAWAAEWSRLSGGHPFLIYSGAWWWAPHVGTFRGVDVTPYLWHSHYLAADTDVVPDDPAAFAARIPASWWVSGYGGWPQASILQFTSQGDAGELGNKVDLNVYRGSMAELLTLARATAPTAPEGVDMAGLRIAAVGGNKWFVGDGIWYRVVATWPEHQDLIGSGAVEKSFKPTDDWQAWTGRTLASTVDIDAAELDSIKAAAMAGAGAALSAGLPAVVDSMIAALPPGAMTRADLEAVMEYAVREAFAHGLADDAASTG